MIYGTTAAIVQAKTNLNHRVLLRYTMTTMAFGCGVARADSLLQPKHVIVH